MNEIHHYHSDVYWQISDTPLRHQHNRASIDEVNQYLYRIYEYSRYTYLSDNVAIKITSSQCSSKISEMTGIYCLIPKTMVTRAVINQSDIGSDRNSASGKETIGILVNRSSFSVMLIESLCGLPFFPSYQQSIKQLPGNIIAKRLSTVNLYCVTLKMQHL